MSFFDGVKLDVSLDLPALVFIVIFSLLFYVLFRTQRANNNFDFSEMLKDENGKPSSARLATFVCLAASTWAIMYILVTKKGDIDPWIIMGYTGIWSGAKVAEVAIDRYYKVNGGASTNTSVKPAKDAS